MRDRRYPIAMLVGFGALILHCGCNVTMTMPELRYITPEVRGGAGSGHAVLIAQQATGVVLVPSTLAAPPVTDEPRFTPELRDLPAFTAALSASKRLEFCVRATEDAPLVLDAKYQIAGVPSSSAAREDGFSCALVVGGGAGRDTETNEASDAVVEQELKNHTAEAGVLAGRRFGSILPYGGVYYAHYWADGSIDRGGVRYPFDGSGGQVSVNFGLAATVWHFEARSELSKSFSDWQSEETEETAFGLGLGGSW